MSSVWLRGNKSRLHAGESQWNQSLLWTASAYPRPRLEAEWNLALHTYFPILVCDIWFSDEISRREKVGKFIHYKKSDQWWMSVWQLRVEWGKPGTQSNGGDIVCKWDRCSTSVARSLTLKGMKSMALVESVCQRSHQASEFLVLVQHVWDVINCRDIHSNSTNEVLPQNYQTAGLQFIFSHAQWQQQLMWNIKLC